MRPSVPRSMWGLILGVISCFRAVNNRPYMVVFFFPALFVGAHIMRPSVSFCARLPFSTLARRGARIPAVFSVCARCSRIRNGAGPLFSCKRGPLEKYPTGIFFNSPPKMRPAAMGISPIAMGDAKGLCPFGFPTTFYKRWTKILSCGVATANLLVMSTQTVNGLLGQYKAGILSANDRLDG